MADKNIKGRVAHKHGTSSEWALATTFIPLAGEIIIYTDENKIKIGNGVTVVTELPFTESGKIDGIQIGSAILPIDNKIVNLSNNSDPNLNVATKNDISTLQANFTAGVNSIYDKIVSEGTTPSSKDLSDVVTGIGTLSTDRYNDGVDDTKGTPVVASLTGTASSGASTAVISNVNSMTTITDITGKIAGTDYYEVKATATGTAGSYTPNYTVTTAGWQSSTVNGTAQTVGVTNDTTGKSIYVKAGTEGVPSATKSTVSNHTIVVTPSVTNTVGYIKGSTISGTAASISASELVSGDKALTPAATAQSNIDVTNYKTASVAAVSLDVAKQVTGTTDIVVNAGSVSGTTYTQGKITVDTAGYITTGDKVTGATFANTATSGTTYKDISDTTAAPVLVSKDYLYINKGYTDDVKISLAHLVPDKASAKLSSAVILNGYSAYNNDGELIAGNIQSAVLSASGSVTTSGSGSVSPGTNTISKNNNTNVSTGTVATTKPSTGYYLAVDASTAQNTGSITVSGTGTASAGVTSTGYATTALTGSGSVSGTGTASVTVPQKDAATTYFPITSGSVSLSDQALSVSPTVTPTPIASATASGLTLGSVGTAGSGVYIQVTGGNSATDGSTTSGESCTVTKKEGYIAGGTATVTSSAVASAKEVRQTVYYPVTGATIPVDTKFTLTSVADTVLDTTSDITVVNNAYRNLVLTNEAYAKTTTTNKGTEDIITSGITNAVVNGIPNSHTGTITVNAYDKTATDGTAVLSGAKTIVSSGNWATTEVTPSASAQGPYYGKTTIKAAATVQGTMGGSASGGSASAAISNVNSMATITDISGKTAGTDYYEVKATATGTAGSYTPKYTVTNAGWLASTVNGTAQTVSVTGDSTGKSIYVKAVSPAFDGGAATIKSSSTSATASGLTISDTDTDPGSGIYITTAGTAIPTRAAVLYNGAVDGYVKKSDNTTASDTADGSSTSLTTNKYYVTNVSIPASKSLTITNAGTATFTNSGTETITNSGTVTSTGGTTNAVAGGSTSSHSGTITVNAYGTSSDTSMTGAKTIVSSGNWATTSLTATSTTGTYYGKVGFTQPTQKAAATYNTSTSDQTIAAGNYLTGVQTIRAVKTATTPVDSTTDVSGIQAASILKGAVIKVGDANNATRIANVTGTADYVKTVSSVPTTKDTSIIYCSADSKYYLWKD